MASGLVVDIEHTWVERFIDLAFCFRLSERVGFVASARHGLRHLGCMTADSRLPAITVIPSWRSLASSYGNMPPNDTSRIHAILLAAGVYEALRPFITAPVCVGIDAIRSVLDVVVVWEYITVDIQLAYKSTLMSYACLHSAQNFAEHRHLLGWVLQAVS